MSDNVVWQPGEVSRRDRARLLGHGGATVWLTGLPAAGKTTIAVAVEAALIARGVLSYRLDGDNVRHGICADLGFDAHARDENIRRVGEISKLFADAGLVVLASFISPYRDGRAQVRAIHEAAKIPFVEVFVDCPLEVAEARDPKGMYARARAGEIHDFTGVDAPYEAPLSPDLHLRSDEHTLDDEVARVIGALTGVIGARAIAKRC
jgi:adenylylsulfate kinase